MKIYSIDIIIKHIKRTCRRFPLVCIDALLGTFSGFLTVSEVVKNGSDGFLFWHKVLMVCAIGFPLLLSIALFLESQKWSGIKAYLAHIIGIIFLLLYYFSLPGPGLELLRVYLIRFVLLFFAALILLMISPFLGQKQDSQIDFWQYNIFLLSRFIWTAVYSAILFIGLVLSLLTLRILFNLESIDIQTFYQVWILVVGLISTLFFLSGIPQEFSKLHANKIFVQYILFPLTVIYLAILYVYAGKILIDGQWPKGMVSYMVMSFSMVGIFAWLLGYVQILKQKGLWRWLLRRGFYIALIPLIIMLFASISIRVHQYGLTEKRCLIIILGLWLLGISLYFIWSIRQNIKIIFYSLFIVMLIAVFMAPAVSKFSQLRRLEHLLTDNQILVDGKVKKIEKQEIGFDDQKEISSIMNYIDKTYGPKVLQKWFNKHLDELEDFKDIAWLKDLEYTESRKTGINIQPGINIQDDERFFSFSSPDSSSVSNFSVTEYDYLLQLNAGWGSDWSNLGMVKPERKYDFILEKDAWFLQIKKDQKLLAKIDLEPFLDQLKNSNFDRYNVPSKEMMIETETTEAHFEIYFNEIHYLQGRAGMETVNYVRGFVLVDEE